MNRSFLLVSTLAFTGCQQDYEIVSPVDINPGELTKCGFTPIKNTRFSRYDCNPVFTGTDEKWGDAYLMSVGFHAEEVLGHPFYQMWYTAIPSDPNSNHSYGLGYAVSHNGVDWENHPKNPVFKQPYNNDWDRDQMAQTQVVWDAEAEEYVMAYQGVRDGATATDNRTGLGFYKSKNGIKWDYYVPTREMALSMSDQLPDGNSMCWPLAFTKFGDEFEGYMGGGPWVQNTAADPDAWKESKCQIYSYSAQNLSNIHIESKPVLEAGPLTYDYAGMTDAAVVSYKGTLFMFYISFETWTEDPGQGWIYTTNPHIAFATSRVGSGVWTKSAGNPYDQLVAVESGNLNSIAAQKVGDRIHLWIGDAYEDPDDKNGLVSGVGYFLFEPELKEKH